MYDNLPISPAVVEVDFPYKELSASLKTSPLRPLHDVPDLMLQDIKEGLDALPDRRLFYGAYIGYGDSSDGCACAVGAGLLNAESKKTGVPVERLLHIGDLPFYQPSWMNGKWSVVSSLVNDKFGSPVDKMSLHPLNSTANHPTVQKARYWYVYGIVASELALRGLTV